MTDSSSQPDLFTEPTGQTETRAIARYFNAQAHRDYSLWPQTLWRAELQASLMARNPSMEEGLAEGSTLYRQRAKNNIISLLEFLQKAMPAMADQQQAMGRALHEYRDAQQKGDAASKAPMQRALDTMKVQLRGVISARTPPYLAANPDDAPMLRRQNLKQQLTYLQEVYNAAAEEAKSGQGNMRVLKDSALLAVLREMSDTLLLYRLHEALDKAADTHQQLANHPNPRMNTHDWTYEKIETRDAMRNVLAEFNAKVNPQRLARIEKTPLKHTKGSEDTPDTVGHVLKRMQQADTLDEMLAAKEMLHTHIALRANFMKDDLAASYAQDYSEMNRIIGRRRKKDERTEYNPFTSQDVPVRAGYEAQWAKLTHQALDLMDRYEATLRDPAMAPLATLPRPEPSVKGKITHAGRSAELPVGPSPNAGG